MRLYSIQELRAVVGDDGRDLSDDELHAFDVQCARLFDIVRGTYLDRVDPAGAARRRPASEIAAEQLRAARRKKYERERAAIGKTPRRRTA